MTRRGAGTAGVRVCVWRRELPEDGRGLDTHCVGGLRCERSQQAGASWAASSSGQAWPPRGPGAWGPGGPPGRGREENVSYAGLTSSLTGSAWTSPPSRCEQSGTYLALQVLDPHVLLLQVALLLGHLLEEQLDPAVLSLELGLERG